MADDVAKEYRDNMQEIMFELKLKTDKFLKKLKDETGRNRVKYEK